MANETYNDETTIVPGMLKIDTFNVDFVQNSNLRDYSSTEACSVENTNLSPAGLSQLKNHTELSLNRLNNALSGVLIYLGSRMANFSL